MGEEPVKLKQCTKCKQIYPATTEYFNRRTASKDGLTYKCKKCEAAQARNNYRERKRKKKMHEYYMENRERHLENSARNYQENREARLAYNKEYIQTHKGKLVKRRADAKRHWRIKNQKGTPYTREEIIKRDSVVINGVLTPICQICHQPILNSEEIEIDHIVPLSEGGLDCKDNVRTTHKRCNVKRPRDGRDLFQSVN